MELCRLMLADIKAIQRNLTEVQRLAAEIKQTLDRILLRQTGESS